LQNPLSEALLKGDFCDGDTVVVDLNKTADSMVFDVKNAKTPAC